MIDSAEDFDSNNYIAQEVEQKIAQGCAKFCATFIKVNNCSNELTDCPNGLMKLIPRRLLTAGSNPFPPLSVRYRLLSSLTVHHQKCLSLRFAPLSGFGYRLRAAGGTKGRGNGMSKVRGKVHRARYRQEETGCRKKLTTTD